MAAIEIPSTVGFRSRSFDIVRKQQITPGSGGFLQTQDRTTPMWGAEYSTPPLDENGVPYADMLTFLDSLEGALATFLAYDPARIMPRAYKNQSTASDPWTQAGQTAPRITAQNYAASTISLDRLLNGAIISNGDLISVYMAPAWYLFRSRTTATVTGNAATLIVSPRPQIAGFAAANIRYRKACFEAKVIGGFKNSGTVDTPPAFSFKALQFVARS